MLDLLMPSVVIVMDPDVALVRELEVFQVRVVTSAPSLPVPHASLARQAEHPCHRLRVYFMAYRQSAEVHYFSHSMRQEQAAFDKLIHERSHVTVAKVTADPQARAEMEAIDREAKRSLLLAEGAPACEVKAAPCGAHETAG